MAKIVVANWKMNPQSQKEVEFLLSKMQTEAKNVKNTQIVICPPFPFLYLFKKLKSKKIFLGSQNISSGIEGPYTGEVSPKMLKNLGVQYFIVGHSERRALGESDKIINEKVLNLLKFKFTPIICIGEATRDKDGFYLSYIGEQIKDCLSGVSKSQIKNVIIAYEPIWAIGANATREATKEEFIEIKIFIKKIISDIYHAKVAHNIPIIYGGSVNPQNAQPFIKEGEADGLLIGRDSLNPKKFGAILSAIN